MSRKKRARKQAARKQSPPPSTSSAPPATAGSAKKWLLTGAVLLVAAVAAALLREGNLKSPPASSAVTPSTATPSTVPPSTGTIENGQPGGRPAVAQPAGRAVAPQGRPIIISEVGADRSNQENWQKVDDPGVDGWKTESLHLAVKKQLHQLGEVLTDPAAAATSDLSQLVAENFACSSLVPKRLVAVMTTPLLTVQRSTAEDSGTSTYAGADGLATAIQEGFSFLKNAEDIRFQFKVISVELSPDDEHVTTRQLFSLSARTQQGMVEQHATWESQWKVASDHGAPRLASIAIADFEQSATRDVAGPLMSDCTEAALAGNASYQQQIARGANHWLERIPFRTMLNLFSMPGIAVGDANGDGLDDVYLCQDPGLPNRLFLQQPDGTLRDASDAWGVNWIEDARSALLVDLDNDGDQDLVVAIRAAVVVAENENQEKFHLKTVLPMSEDATSLCAADYDADGRLDIYACAYQPNELLRTSSGASMGAAMPQFVLHDANNGGANSLFRNTGTAERAFQFVDVTEQLGLDVNNRRWSLAAAWEDYDNDGDLDLYVANDYGRDNLYRNDAGAGGEPTFVDVGDAAHVESSAAGMAIAWGDYDRDGWMDAYVSNMWSSAGHRVTSQPQFKPEASDEVRDRLRHFAAGNTLLRNCGDGTFANRSAAANVAMGRWAWGNGFLDLDNDGWEDLIVANGYMTTDDSGDL